MDRPGDDDAGDARWTGRCDERLPRSVCARVASPAVGFYDEPRCGQDRAPRGDRKSENPTWKEEGSEGAFSRLFTRTGRDAVLTRRLPLRLFMMTTTVTSGHGGSSSSGSRSSFPLGFGRPSSARTSLLMAAARNPNFVEGKRKGSSTGANRARTTQRNRVETTPPPLGVLEVLERERAPPGCADSRGVALARLNGGFRKQW